MMRDILCTASSCKWLAAWVLSRYTVQKHRYKTSMIPGTPVLRSTRLLDQVRERVRYLHYSLSTEKAYLYWVRFFIRWHGRSGAMRHPREMGAQEVEAFLTMLATERWVSASTQNQALSALLFLYREVLAIDFTWLNSGCMPEAFGSRTGGCSAADGSMDTTWLSEHDRPPCG